MDRTSSYAEFTGVLLSIDGGEAMPLHSVWVFKHHIEVRRRGIKVRAAQQAHSLAWARRCGAKAMPTSHCLLQGFRALRCMSLLLTWNFQSLLELGWCAWPS